ncbi:hypothetical protein DSM25558_3255 [Agrobacterium sp. DSM 25558]|nr:hypothetical protein DSM25558_3255 [Agrobacterium sp. DSM 25558]
MGKRPLAPDLIKRIFFFRKIAEFLGVFGQICEPTKLLLLLERMLELVVYWERLPIVRSEFVRRD